MEITENLIIGLTGLDDDKLEKLIWILEEEAKARENERDMHEAIKELVDE